MSRSDDTASGVPQIARCWSVNRPVLPGTATQVYPGNAMLAPQHGSTLAVLHWSTRAVQHGSIMAGPQVLQWR